MSKPRRLVVKEVDKRMFLTHADGRPLEHWQIDLTGIHNADTRTPLTAVVQEQCNLGCWHDRDSYRLLPWGPE
jgi:hypothetical protein